MAKTKWSELNDEDRERLFCRSREIIQGRAAATGAWAALCLKFLVTSNAAAAIACLTFMGAAFAKGTLVELNIPAGLFGAGFTFSLFVALLTFLRANSLLRAECKWFEGMMEDKEKVSWNGNPARSELVILVIGSCLASLSFALFLVGGVWVFFAVSNHISVP